MTQYSEKSYKMASDNTKYNATGKAVILENDEWRDEKEWDEVFELMQNEQKISEYENQLNTYMQENRQAIQTISQLEATIESAKAQYNELMETAIAYRDEAIKWRSKFI